MKKIKSNYIILFVVLFLLTCCFNRKEKIEDEIETGTNIADTGFI